MMPSTWPRSASLMSAFLISGAILRVVVSAYAATSSNVGIG